MSNENSSSQSDAKATYSSISILSTVFGAIPICSILFVWINNKSLPGGDLADGTIILCLLGSTIIFTTLALVLGIIALSQKNRKKLFAVIGVSLSSLIVLSVVAMIVRVVFAAFAP